jgi:hypothetical protein
MKEILFGFVVLVVSVGNVQAQESMSMVSMENSVGYLPSGSSLEPKVTSEFSPMVHKNWGDWTFSLHGNAFLVHTQQKSPRGGDKIFSANWVMPMFTRTSGKNAITFRTMFSAEPATVTKREYPLLFQTGETAFGRGIVDGQHPHDLIMELAARYDRSLGERTQLFVYAGPIAEPALGPVAFPHRASASENPAAVLGHHYQDSTHISNSVATLGLSHGPFQIEASTFHGGEPNENRWNIDTGKPDSFSGRLTLAAGNTITGQFSMGRINSREPEDPDTDSIRTTASLHHSVRFSTGHIASSLIWGRNRDFGHGDERVFNSYGLESTVNFRSLNWLWTRIENVDRDSAVLTGETQGHSEETPIGRIQAWTLGYEREISTGTAPVRLGVGLQTTFYSGLTPAMQTIYGNRPAGMMVFLRLRPRGNMMLHMQAMHQH